MANNPGNSDKFRASGREKFDLNLRSHLEICHGKQTHADVAEIDTKTIQLCRLGEYLHGGVQQLAFPASPVWFEAPFEDHLSTGKDTVAKRSLRAKITNVQWNVERLFNRYPGLSKTGGYTHKQSVSVICAFGSLFLIFSKSRRRKSVGAFGATPCVGQREWTRLRSRELSNFRQREFLDC
jgi:hypothetical protein